MDVKPNIRRTNSNDDNDNDDEIPANRNVKHMLYLV